MDIGFWIVNIDEVMELLYSGVTIVRRFWQSLTFVYLGESFNFLYIVLVLFVADLVAGKVWAWDYDDD